MNVARTHNRKIDQYQEQSRFLLNKLVQAEYELTNVKQILEACSDAILITTPDAKIVYVNPAWEKLTGYSFLEVEGKNPRFLKSGKTPPKIYKKLWSNLTGGKSFSNEQLIDKRKDGSEFLAHSTTFPVSRFDSILYYVQFLFDISKRKQLEDLKSEFLSVVSHELKTPITVLKLLAQSRLAQRKKNGTITIKSRDLEMIDYELDRMTRLINDMLDISKIENNKLNLNLIQFNLNELIAEVLRNMQLISKNHKLEYINNTNLIIIADRQRINQVLVNLIINAIKYSPEGTTVKINVEEIKNRVQVSIADEGIGISIEKQSQIFQRFYQVHNNSTGGFGLGLYISKEILKKHKGNIWVESKEDIGSTFYFILPTYKLS